MASGRRGGPPDLKSTLGSLLRTTLDQVGAVKDVVERQARSRGGIINQALVSRRRRDAMARLGESVYRLSQSGELGEMALDPVIGMALAEIDEIDEIDEDSGDMLEGHFNLGDEYRNDDQAVSSATYRPPARRSEPGSEYRVWRPVMPQDDAPQDDLPLDVLPQDEPDTIDEYVASPSGVPAPKIVSPGPNPKAIPSARVPSASSAVSETGSGMRLPRKSARRSGGGIHFVEEEARPGELDCDDDLDSYMHDDDVPQDS